MKADIHPHPASTKRNYILQLLTVFVGFLIFGSMAVSGTMMNLSHFFYGLSSFQ